MLKRLNNFQLFEADKFLEKLDLMGLKCELWSDYESKQIKGIKITATVWSDSHDYGNDSVSNVGEQLVIKVLDSNAVLLDFKTPHFIEAINPKGTIYGEFSNQLSLVADQVVIMEDDNDEF